MDKKVLYLLPDTNLFIQCRPLHEIDWAACSDFAESQEIQLLVTNPVHREIDKMKNRGNDRIGRQARKASSDFREIVTSGKDIAIMEGGPGTMVLGGYEKHVLGPRREAEERARQAEERAEERVRQANAKGKAWNERRLQAEARGEPFDEPFPGIEDAKRREAIESTILFRLQRHWVWPHIMILFLVCLVIDLVALGYGIVWLVKYVAGFESSGIIFRITAGSLLLIGAYGLLYKFFRWWYRR